MIIFWNFECVRNGYIILLGLSSVSMKCWEIAEFNHVQTVHSIDVVFGWNNMENIITNNQILRTRLYQKWWLFTLIDKQSVIVPRSNLCSVHSVNHIFFESTKRSSSVIFSFFFFVNSFIMFFQFKMVYFVFLLRKNVIIITFIIFFADYRNLIKSHMAT